MKKLPIKITIIGLLVMLVSACGSSAYDYRTERRVDHVDVMLGKATMVGNTSLSVMFDSIEKDSRCPINAKCAWSGVGIVNVIVINAAGESKKLALSTINFENYNKVENAFGKDFELMELLPKRVAGSGAKSEITKTLIKLSVD